MSLVRRAGRVLGWLLSLAAVVLGGLSLAPVALGMERYVVTGGSMGEAAPRGAVILSERVAVDELRRGDVITYAPPRNTATTAMVTHRITWIGRDRSGARAFRTKGDANPQPDPWRFVLDREEQARMAAVVPLVGYPLAALSLRWARMLFIGLPALLIGASIARQLWRADAEPCAASASS